RIQEKRPQSVARRPWHSGTVAGWPVTFRWRATRKSLLRRVRLVCRNRRPGQGLSSRDFHRPHIRGPFFLPRLRLPSGSLHLPLLCPPPPWRLTSFPSLRVGSAPHRAAPTASNPSFLRGPWAWAPAGCPCLPDRSSPLLCPFPTSHTPNPRASKLSSLPNSTTCCRRERASGAGGRGTCPARAPSWVTVRAARARGLFLTRGGKHMSARTGPPT